MQGIDLSKYFTPKDLLVYALLIIIVIYALYKLNIIGTRRGTKKASKQRDKQKSEIRNRKIAIFFMKQFSNIYNLIGNSTPEYLFELKYLIDRNEVKVKALDRRLKPEELVGIFRFIQLLIILAVALTVAFTLNFALFSLMFLIFVPKLYTLLLKGQIAAEDEQLEIDFPDLYLLLYSRLKKGAHTQIEPTMNDYIRSLNDMYGVGVGHRAIRRFCARFSANVEIYGDEIRAVKEMREYYRSPTVINFCNLAIQALSGVDNREKLLTFKQELAEERRVRMDLRAAALVRKGTRAINIIYVILFEFIILSWVSKIDLSLFNSFLG